jgi:hypothetical protein
MNELYQTQIMAMMAAAEATMVAAILAMAPSSHLSSMISPSFHC